MRHYLVLRVHSASLHTLRCNSGLGNNNKNKYLEISEIRAVLHGGFPGLCCTPFYSVVSL